MEEEESSWKTEVDGGKAWLSDAPYEIEISKEEEDGFKSGWKFLSLKIDGGLYEPFCASVR
jgi:hypothetical protein